MLCASLFRPLQSVVCPRVRSFALWNSLAQGTDNTECYTDFTHTLQLVCLLARALLSYRLPLAVRPTLTTTHKFVYTRATLLYYILYMLALEHAH